MAIAKCALLSTLTRKQVPLNPVGYTSGINMLLCYSPLLLTLLNKELRKGSWNHIPLSKVPEASLNYKSDPVQSHSEMVFSYLRGPHSFFIVAHLTNLFQGIKGV